MIVYRYRGGGIHDEVIMNNKKDFFSTVFCIFIAVLFLFGCNNHLLKLQQEEAHLIVKIANSTGARNASTTGDWQISAWIENQDGSESHHQNLNSASGEETSLTFDDLVIGSQIKIHLELTKNDDTQTKLTGTSGWKTIEEGVNVIIIVLTEDHGAQVPVIKEINSTIETYTSNPKPVTATLKADASVADGGTLTYQWYSSDSPTTDSGTAIEGATNATYEAKVEAGKTKYFYCVVTNTNDNVNGNKTASATSNIATVASIVGQLDRITAQYIGSTYELVNSEINYRNIEIVQVYAIPDAEPQEISVFASSVKEQYSIQLRDNNGIGNVPATVTHVTETQIKDDFTIPVKYTLDTSHLTLNGTTSVEQNGTLELTANYPDTTYQIYDGNGGSTTYQVKDNLNISWIGATAQSDAWKATANTQTTGSQTATVKLTPKDDWCVTTSGVEKSHEYEVTAATTAGGISTQEQLVQAIANASAEDTITISNTITITETLVIDKNITITGTENSSLNRATGTVTGPMIEVKMGVTLDLSYITLNGQMNTDGENNPLIYINTGKLMLTGVTLQNNHMVYYGAYKDKGGQSVFLYAAAAIYALDSDLTIMDSSFTNFSDNDGQGGVINIESTSSGSNLFISNSTVEASLKQSNRALQMGSDNTKFGYITYSINDTEDGLTRQITSITPNSIN